MLWRSRLSMSTVKDFKLIFLNWHLVAEPEHLTMLDVWRFRLRISPKNNSILFFLQWMALKFQSGVFFYSERVHQTHGRQASIDQQVYDPGDSSRVLQAANVRSRVSGVNHMYLFLISFLHKTYFKPKWRQRFFYFYVCLQEPRGQQRTFYFYVCLEVIRRQKRTFYFFFYFCLSGRNITWRSPKTILQQWFKFPR